MLQSVLHDLRVKIHSISILVDDRTRNGQAMTYLQIILPCATVHETLRASLCLPEDPWGIQGDGGGHKTIMGIRSRTWENRMAGIRTDTRAMCIHWIIGVMYSGAVKSANMTSVSSGGMFLLRSGRPSQDLTTSYHCDVPASSPAFIILLGATLTVCRP